MSTTWLMFPTLAEYTTQYYIDSVAGSDSNNGLSELTPFQTLAKMQTLAGSVPAWTQINLKRGSVWTGASAYLSIDQANMKITDYGDSGDPLPKIDGRITMTAGSWTNHSGACYKYDVTAVLDTAVQLNIWENGTRLARAADVATCISTAGTYYVPPEGGSWVNGSPTTVYMHASDGSNPTSSGKVYTTQGVAYVIYLGSETNENAKLYNVEAMGGCHHNGNVFVGRNSYSEGVVVRWGTIHSLYTDSGFFVNCTSYDCEQGFDFVANKGSSSDGFIEMNGCLSDVDETSAVISGGPGFFVHGNTFDTIRYINCICREHLSGFGVAACKGTIYIDGCLATSSSTVTTDNKMFDFANDGYVPSCAITMVNNISDSYGFHVYGYGLKSDSTLTASGERIVSRGFQVAYRGRLATFDIQHCSLYSPGAAAYTAYEMDAAGAITFSHNIVDGYDLAVETWAGTYVGNDNVFYHHASGFRIGGSYYSTFSAFQSGVTPQETNSASGNPLWAATPSTAPAYDFTVSGGSPADASSRDAGWHNR